MKGTKTVKFDFAIAYSYQGVFCEANEISLREPGLAHYGVYTTMYAYVAEAMTGFMALRSQMDDATAEVSEEEVQALKNPDEEKDVMQLMAMGLGVAKYPEFASYVKKVLTGQSKLAAIGEQKVALTEEVWSALEEQGGIEAAMRLFSEFTGFFFDKASSKSLKTTGANSSPSSASPSKGPSAGKPPASTRSRN